MQETKKIRLPFVTVVMIILAACGSSGSEYEEEARERAIVAAQVLVTSNHDDTIQMESIILDAKSIQSEYLLKGDTIAAQAFDNAFQEYVTANDPQLAKEIFK